MRQTRVLVFEIKLVCSLLPVHLLKPHTVLLGGGAKGRMRINNK